MAKVSIGAKTFEVDAIVFDKDGTLIDFHHMWGQRALRAVAQLLRAIGYDKVMEENLFRALGYDKVTELTREDGPLATIPLAKTDIVIATMLYINGMSWEKAEGHVRESFSPIMAAEPTPDLVRPLGRPAESMTALNRAGVQTVIATTDNRQPTLKSMEMLGIQHSVKIMFCGDDTENPKKPSPDVLYQIANRCKVSVGKIMMVGDTVSDLSMAKHANAAAAIGVVGGANTKEGLLGLSDALISSIDEIRVVS